MGIINNVLNSFCDFMWGIPLAGLIAVVSIIITVKTGGFQFRYFGHIMKNTLGNIFDKGTGKTGSSPFVAACASMANTIGTGNIVGVAVAIGMGGPGAIFWMWMVALFGSIIKYAEVVLSIRYREPDPLTGNYLGSMSGIARNGLSKNWRWLSHAAAIAILIAEPIGLGVHTNGFTDAITTAYPVSPAIIGVIVTIITAALVFGGWKYISTFSSICVPVMAILYIIAGTGVIAMNISALPTAFALIFKCAFTGHAAVGGFVGATFFAAFSNGMARGVYSSAAGQGLAPYTHVNADCEHPVRQGLWGITEVFIDTIIICTFTALVILCTGEWESGLAGSPLVTASFAGLFGGSTKISAVFVAVILILFGFSSMIVDIYNSEACLAEYINTNVSRVILRCISLCFVFFGCVGGLESVYILNDTAMAFMVLFTVLIILLKNKELTNLTKEYISKYINVKE